MAGFEEIDSARKLLDPEEEATLEEIKMAYKEICRLYHIDKHPDKSKSHCEQMMKKINHAYNGYDATHKRIPIFIQGA